PEPPTTQTYHSGEAPTSQHAKPPTYPNRPRPAYHGATHTAATDRAQAHTCPQAQSPYRRGLHDPQGPPANAASSNPSRLTRLPTTNRLGALLAPLQQLVKIRPGTLALRQLRDLREHLLVLPGQRPQRAHVIRLLHRRRQMVPQRLKRPQPVARRGRVNERHAGHRPFLGLAYLTALVDLSPREMSQDRKSTRLNSSHVSISYAVV